MGSTNSAYQGDDDECISDGGGVIKRIPIEVKPRGRLGLRSTSSNAGPYNHKPGSTRSVLSVQEENHELEKLRRQYEMYKLDKDNECAAIEKRRRKYDTQNKKLNAELQTIQKTCKKLREERDSALRAEHQAIVRASAFQQDRDVVQRQFKIYRESKERELQVLLKEKRHLETTVRTRRISITVADDDNNTWWPDSEPSLGSLSQLNTVHISTYELDKIDDCPYVHVNRDDWQVIQNHADVADFNNNIVHICVIPTCTDNDVSAFNLSMELDKNFYYKFLLHNIILCSTYLRHHYNKGCKESEYLKIKKSSILVIVLGTSQINFTEEFYTCCFNGFIEKTIFIVINSERQDYQSILSSIKARLPNIEVIPVNGRDADNTAFNYLSLILNKRHFQVNKDKEYQVNTNICHLDIYECENTDALWDINDEQREMFNYSLQSSCQIAFEHLYETISTFISHSGPSPPFLIKSSKPCSGKSLLVAKWIELHRVKSPPTIIICHQIMNKDASHACASLIIRRLTFELIKLLPTSTLQSFTCDSSRIFAEFPRLLEKVCNYHTDIVIILDSLDKIQDSSKMLNWLLDPLPINCKVIVTADLINPAWIGWPSVQIEQLSQRHARELINNTKMAADISEGQRSTLEDYLGDGDAADISTLNPLFCILLSDLITSLPDVIDNVKCGNLDELYFALLLFLDPVCDNFLKQVLLLISTSMNGLSQYELLSLLVPITDHEQFLYYDYLLLRYGVVKQLSGLYLLANTVIEHVFRDYYKISAQDVHNTRVTLKSYFQDDLNRHKPVNCRIADELLFQNLKLSLDDDLRENLLDMKLFLEYYKRGRCCQILDYWIHLAIDRKQIASLYRDVLNNLESFDKENSDVYHAVGKFLRDICMLSFAETILQKSLEIREAILDPEDCKIAESLHDLADLYLSQERFQIAEQLFRQALDIYTNTFGSEHCLTACEMTSIAIVLQKQSRITQAEAIRKKVFNIHKNCLGRRNNKNKRHNFNSNTMVVEESLKSLDNNLDLARTLNELGVLQYLQQDTRTAENFLLKSLQIREQVSSPGENSNDVAQSLCNLAALYYDSKQYTKALPLYEKALHIRRQNFDKDHSSITTVLKNLALCNKKLNNLDAAIVLYSELLESHTRTLTLNNPIVATTMVNLSVLHSQLNDYTKAKYLYEQAIVIYEQLFGENDIRLADTIRNLALLEYKQDEFERAAELYNRAKKMKENLMEGINR